MTNEEKIRLTELSKALARALEGDNDQVKSEITFEIIEIYLSSLSKISLNVISRPTLIVAIRKYAKILEASASEEELEFVEGIMEHINISGILRPQ